MRNFILGTLFGIVIATIGLTGLAGLLDNGINKLKSTISEVSQT
jgi:hypothetical protein